VELEINVPEGVDVCGIRISAKTKGGPQSTITAADGEERALPVLTAAFMLAAIAAGLAGGLQAALTGFIAPSSFPFSQSILVLLVVVVGGAGRTLGPLVEMR